MMKAEGFIASKLRFKGKLAAIAIAVSFLVMILSLAISGGFRKAIHDGISSVSGDILMTGSGEPVSAIPSYYDKLLEVKGVESITPVIWKPAIIKGPDDISGVMVKGVPMADSCTLKARIPARLASKLRLAEGDRLTAYFVEDRVKARRFTVSELYESPLDSDDMLTMIVPLADMQRLHNWDSSETGALEIKVSRGFEGAEQVEHCAMNLSATAFVEHVEDEEILRAESLRMRYPQLFDWLDLIDFNVLAIIVLMTIVAGFNMISGLLILLFRSISTIGMLKSLGMGNKAIAGVFLRVAARLVAIGMVIGNAAALLLCLIQEHTRVIKLDPANYFVSYVPVDINLPLMLAVDAAAFAAIMILMLIPTLFIAKVDPAETVRVR